MSKHTHSDHDGPQSEMVGALIALAVVTIVFNGLFFDAWWAILVKIVLAFNFIKEIIKYLNNDTARKNYRYHTNKDEVIQLWIATIIVSVILSILFDGQWWALIVPTVLKIKAVEITILYIITRNQLSKDARTAEMARSDVYGQAQPIRRVVQVVATTEASAPMVTISSEVGAAFCPMCGAGHDADDLFCQNCGNDIRL